ncbi:MAG: hypothetical protein R2736_02380 [Solirubrobacterales bacterium]
MDVEAAAGPAARERHAHEAAQAGVVAGAAVVEAGGGDVADARALGGAQAVLPFLLVAVELAALVEAPDALQCAAADRRGCPEGVGRVGVERAEVEERHRRPLTPAHGEPVASSSATIGPVKQSTPGSAAARGAQRAEPAGVDGDVVVA